jgi:hypothetical protein
MASIFLKRRELAGGERLPKVCVVCGRRGRPTDVTLRHRSNLPFSPGAVTITQFQEAVLPLCSAHRDYFERLNVFILAGFGILALLLISAAVCFFLFGLGAFAVFFLLFVFCVLVFGFVSFFVSMGRTRASAIEDRGVWLANVSEKFVEALEDLRDDRAERRRERDREYLD